MLPDSTITHSQNLVRYNTGRLRTKKNEDQMCKYVHLVNLDVNDTCIRGQKINFTVTNGKKNAMLILFKKTGSHLFNICWQLVPSMILPDMIFYFRIHSK